MPHLRDLKPIDLLDLIDEIHDGNGSFKLQNIPLNVKVDGFGGRFGKNSEGKPFMGTSRTEPRYQASFVDYHQKKGTQDPDILGRAQLFDDLFGEMMNAVKLVDSKLGGKFLVNKQVTCEVLFLPFATETPEGKLKFVGIQYDKLPDGVELALVPFAVVDADSGNDIPNSSEIIKKLTGLGRQGSVMFIDNSLTQNDALDVTAIVPPLENIEQIKSLLSSGKLAQKREAKELLAPVALALEKAIINDPNIVGKDMLGKDYEGIVLNTRLGPVKVTSAEQKDIIANKNAAQAAARTDRGRENSNKTAVVAIGSFVGHKGHEELLDYTIKKAKSVGGDPYLFIGNAEGKDDPIPPAVKVQTWHKLYPSLADNISTVISGGSLLQKVKHELINPLPGKPPRYDNIIIMVGEDRASMPIAGALMKAVNKFAGYEHVKVSLEVTPRGTGISGTALRNSLKNDSPEKALAVWSNAFDVNKLGVDWIEHLMAVTRKGMGLKEPAVESTINNILNNINHQDINEIKSVVMQGGNKFHTLQYELKKRNIKVGQAMHEAIKTGLRML
jgi:predicted SpoU family rRNA methylase